VFPLAELADLAWVLCPVIKSDLYTLEEDRVSAEDLDDLERVRAWRKTLRLFYFDNGLIKYSQLDVLGRCLLDI